MFASPEQANKTVKQIGEVIKKKFKGKPVGEALGRLLGNVQIGTHGGDGGDADAGDAPPAKQKQSAKPRQQAEPDADASGQDDSSGNAPADEPEDPDLQRILR
jgi:hypothetical protein